MAGLVKRLGKWLIRRALAPVLYHGGGIWLIRRLRRAGSGEGRLLVLLYHRVADLPGPAFRYQSDTLALPRRRFAEQMAYLARRHRVLPLERALQDLEGGRLPPTGAIAITFDDGYRDNLTDALPILRRHGLPATLFLATGCIGTGRPAWFDRLAPLLERLDLSALRGAAGRDLTPGIDALIGDYLAAPTGRRRELINLLCEAFKEIPDARKEAIMAAMAESGGGGAGSEDARLMLDWAGVRALAEAGVGIGSHSRSHPILSRLPADDAVAEIVLSKRDIESRLGTPCRLFAYPNGRPADIPADAPASLAAAGYRAAFTTVPGTNARGTDRMAMRRLPVGDYEPALFALLVEYHLLAG